MQCPEFSTTPVVFISGTTSTEVNKGTLLSEERMASVRMRKSNVKGVWVEGEVYHLWKYLLTKKRWRRTTHEDLRCGRKFKKLCIFYWIKVFFKLPFAVSVSDIYIYIYKTLNETAKGNFKNTLIQ